VLSANSIVLISVCGQSQQIMPMLHFTACTEES